MPVLVRAWGPVSLEKKLSRATRGTAHLTPFLQMPDSTFSQGPPAPRPELKTDNNTSKKVESAVLIPGCGRRANDSTFSDVVLSVLVRVWGPLSLEKKLSRGRGRLNFLVATESITQKARTQKNHFRKDVFSHGLISPSENSPDGSAVCVAVWCVAVWCVCVRCTRFAQDKR